MRRALTFFSIPCLFVLFSCGSFIRDDQIEKVKLYENGVYRTKKDIEINKKIAIKKGTDVRLYLVVSKDWIKVYAYPADTDFLKAKRSLMVYMFEEEFEKKLFDESRFQEKLFECVEKQ